MDTKIINCLEEQKTVREYIEETGAESVLLLFFHGLGDFISFRSCYAELTRAFPTVKFSYGFETGIRYEDFIEEHENYEILRESEENDALIINNYDLVFHIAYGQQQESFRTKAETCTEQEFGLPAQAITHMPFKAVKKKLVGIHFYSTWFPRGVGLVGDNESVAEAIWSEIRGAGYIPIETHFEHKWANPDNPNFGFCNSNVRGCECSAENLISVIQSCHAFLGTHSGNIHAALTCLPPNRVAYLKTYLSRESLTTEPIEVININNYESGSVAEWLNKEN